MKKTYQVILSVLLAVLLLSGCVRGEALQESTAPVDTLPTETQQMSQPHKQTDPTETEETTQPTTQPETEPTQEQTEVTEPKPTEPKPTEHTHQYSKTVTPATCTTDGFTTYTCQCGYSYNSNMVPALGHSWLEWVTVKEPTATEPGLKRRSCSVCGTVQEETIEPGTEPTEHVHQYTAVVTEPTCTAEGYTTYTCPCGHSYVDDKVSAKGHTWGEWETIQKPTETEPGRKKHTCTVCGVTEEADIPVQCNNHEYTQTVTPPTCTTGGFTTYTCKKCGYSYNGNDTVATGHFYGDWHVDRDPTPQAPGLKHRNCTVCGYKDEQEIPYSPTDPSTPPSTEETTKPTESA